VATTQEAVQINAIVPTLTVDDLQKSIAFYEALGFAIDERWEEQGTLLGVMLRAGRTQIGLNQDDWKKGRDRKTTGRKGATARRASACACPSRRRRVTSTRSPSGPGTLASRSSRTLTTRSGRAGRSRSAIRAVSC
jgi:catechol 2,3-dioxygenase-like lactoylglutathione lyase family enzyme